MVSVKPELGVRVPSSENEDEVEDILLILFR